MSTWIVSAPVLMALPALSLRLSRTCAGPSAIAGEIWPVKVPAGSYKAYPVDAKASIQGQEISATTWYANGVGIVKQRADELDLLLISF